MDRIDLRHALERLEPDEAAKQKMLFRLKAAAQAQTKRGQRKCNLGGRRWLVLASAVVVLGAATFTALYQMREPASSLTEGDASSTAMTEIAVVTGQFLWEGKNYSKVMENEALPQTAPAADIGEALGTIEQSSDADLVGETVYQYRPLDCEAVVAVLRGGVYELFTFSYFQSYDDNADEDAETYLKLYGISAPQDIVELEIYRYPDATSRERVTQITDAETIAEFYGHYSQLTESSEAYFEVLSQGTAAPPTGDHSDGTASNNFSPSCAGTAGDKLSNSRTIVIHAANGLSFSAEYYPNIQFLSRYAVDDSFAQWMQEIAF